MFQLPNLLFKVGVGIFAFRRGLIFRCLQNRLSFNQFSFQARNFFLLLLQLVINFSRVGVGTTYRLLESIINRIDNLSLLHTMLHPLRTTADLSFAIQSLFLKSKICPLTNIFLPTRLRSGKNKAKCLTVAFYHRA